MPAVAVLLQSGASPISSAIDSPAVLNTGERALLNAVFDRFLGPDPNIVTFSTSQAHTQALKKLGFVLVGTEEYVGVPTMATVLRAKRSKVKAALGKLPPAGDGDTNGHQTLIDPVCHRYRCLALTRYCVFLLPPSRHLVLFSTIPCSFILSDLMVRALACSPNLAC